MNKNQTGDVLMYQGPDGGDIYVENGLAEMTQGFETMLYLILMGPNEGDDGTDGTSHLQWLGNEDEPDEYQLRGRFHSLLDGEPLTSALLGELQDAAISDITDGFGELLDTVECTVIATSPKSVYISGRLYMSGGAVETFGLELFKK